MIKTGEPIYNAIVWQDRRTAALCETLIQNGHEEYIRKTTGLLIDAYFPEQRSIGYWIMLKVQEQKPKKGIYYVALSIPG